MKAISIFAATLVMSLAACIPAYADTTKKVSFYEEETEVGPSEETVVIIEEEPAQGPSSEISETDFSEPGGDMTGPTAGDPETVVINAESTSTGEEPLLLSIPKAPADQQEGEQGTPPEQADASSNNGTNDAGATATANTASAPSIAISFALSRIGAPYSQARRDSGSYFDCSSFAYAAYKNAGIDLSYKGGHTAATMAEGLVASGKSVSLSNLMPGDLIFYSHERNGRWNNVSHVAMYIGDGRQIECSQSNGCVVSRPLNTSSVVAVCRPA